MASTVTAPRPDLEYLTDQARGGLLYDPARRAYYRIDDRELAALTALSRGADVAGAAAVARMDADAVTALLHRAGDLGLLGPAPGPGSRLTRTGLTLRLSAGDPSALLDRLTAATSGAGRRALMAASAVLAAAGLAVLPIFGSDVPRLPAGAVATTTIVTVLLVTIVHELSHALTLHAYGGKVRDWGVALMYLLPAAYTDCTQMWLLSRRRRRVMVMAAGILAHLVLAGLAGIPLIVPAVRHSAGGAVLVLVATINVLLALTNADPLVKLDGYWILAAVTGDTDLRRRALHAARNAVLGRGDARAAATPALIGYGVAAAVWTGLLLIGALLWWRTQLADVPIPLLLVGAATVAVVLGRRRLGGLVRRMRRHNQR
jgi:putative peptide zinc metalloprotease protein